MEKIPLSLVLPLPVGGGGYRWGRVKNLILLLNIEDIPVLPIICKIIRRVNFYFVYNR